VSERATSLRPKRGYSHRGAERFGTFDLLDDEEDLMPIAT
jgi:hypothetical protein